MTDTVISSFRGGTQHTNTIYLGKVVECTEKRAGKKDQFAITDLIMQNALGYRRLTLSLQAGLVLYDCISKDNRRYRMNNITFEFKVIYEDQKIIGFTMYDASEWIGDTIDREANQPAKTRSRKPKQQPQKQTTEG